MYQNNRFRRKDIELNTPSPLSSSSDDDSNKSLISEINEACQPVKNPENFMKTNGSADKQFSSPNSSEKMPIENGSSTSLKALRNRLNNLPGRLPHGSRSITKDYYYFNRQRFENSIEEKDEVEVGTGITTTLTKTCNFNKVTDNLNFIDARARRRAKLISSRITSSDDEGLEPSSISTGPPSSRITKFYSHKKLKNHAQSSESESDYFHNKFNAQKIKKYPVFLEPLVIEKRNGNFPFIEHQDEQLNDEKNHTVYIPQLDLQSEEQLSTSPEQFKKDSTKRRDLDIDELVEALSQVSLSRSHRAEQGRVNVKKFQTQSAPVSSRQFRIHDDPSKTFRISHQSYVIPSNFTNRPDNHKNIKKLRVNQSSFDGDILTEKKSMTNLVQEGSKHSKTKNNKKIFVNTSTQLDPGSLSKINCPFTIGDESRSNLSKKINNQKAKSPVDVGLKKNGKVSIFSKLFTRKCKNKEMAVDTSKVTKVLYENKNYVWNSSEDSGRSNSQSFGNEKIYDGNKIAGEVGKFSLAGREGRFRMDDQWVKNSTCHTEQNNRDPYNVFLVKNCREEKMISSRKEEQEEDDEDYLSLNEQKNSQVSSDRESRSSLSRSSVTSNTFECKNRKKLATGVKPGCFCFRFCSVLSRKSNL